MKKLISLLFLFIGCYVTHAGVYMVESDDPNEVVLEMQLEIRELANLYSIQKSNLDARIKEINFELVSAISLEEKVELLIEKDQLRETISMLEDATYTEISKIRYIKGLQILKLLYEKILSLDHHFSSVYTFSEINKISNPNSYPEFQQVKDIVRNRKNKKMNFDFGTILEANPFASAAQSFINLFDIDFTSKAKKEELQNIECILDFTLSMHNELNTVYFETSYLQSGNETLKESIETLFEDYTKPIGYTKSLNECRAKDDWSSLRVGLEAYLKEINQAEGRSQFTKRVNIEFPIDRLLQFISEYNNFIDQGEQFYRKFKIILNSYANAEQCKSQLPMEYTKLKNDIDVAIDKFNIAYKPVEINGSKMKEILYGLNEFE